MGTVTLKVNGVEITAQEGKTVLQAVQEANIRYAEVDIPTLYYLKGVQERDDSGVCVVEVSGREGLVQAWDCPVSEGMEVYTETEAAVAARKEALKQILAIHDHACTSCTRTGNCELQTLLRRYHIQEPDGSGRLREEIDRRSIIVRDYNKCIRCRRCVAACEGIQGIGAIRAVGEGLGAVIEPVSEAGLSATKCVNCGQCISVCPVGALTERDNTGELLAALRDPKKFVLVQAAPAVRAALGEEFGFPVGVDVEGRLAAALRELGFDRVFDTKFGADLTIMEETGEFLERLQSGGVLPMMTSCCPGWIKFCEHEFPDMLDHLSSCKSPQQMFGAVAKSWYAEQLGMAKEDIVVVSVMPCTAKKFELGREDENGAGAQDVDISITTRELARMLKQAEIQLEAMPNEDFDRPLGLGTGAGVIFGATGGVMEAALRTAVEKLTGEPLPELAFTGVRGLAGIKEASYEVSGKTIKVAVASGLANARALMEKVRAGEADYQFIEVMACPGGCVNGGGQPIQVSGVRSVLDLRAARAQALYENDAGSALRKSHDNPAIKELYDTCLGRPGSEKAHQLLHTTYVKR